MSLKPLTKSVYLVGPHSTGKSTLTEELKKYYGPNTRVIFEVARKVLKDKGYTAETIGSSTKGFQMQKDIFLAQFQAEELLAIQGLSFISDRSSVDPISYCKMYGQDHKDSWKMLLLTEEWRIMLQRYRDKSKSVVVLTEPVLKFLKDDGTRKMPVDWNEWVAFGNVYAEILELQDIPYHVLGESCQNIHDRVATVVRWIDSV